MQWEGRARLVGAARRFGFKCLCIYTRGAASSELEQRGGEGSGGGVLL